MGRKPTLLIYLTYTSTRVEHGGGSGMIRGYVSSSVTGNQVRSDRKMSQANNTGYRTRRKHGSTNFTECEYINAHHTFQNTFQRFIWKIISELRFIKIYSAPIITLK